MANNVTARLKKAGKEFEILVDLDRALLFKKSGQGAIENVLAVDTIFTNAKNGIKASATEMQAAFKTSDVKAVAAEIVRSGEVQLPQEYKKKEREMKIKQVVDFLSRNCIDPRTGTLHTPARIESALDQAGVSIDDRPVNEQIPNILKKLQPVIPIRIEVKKLLIKVPAIHVGKAYGLFKDIKEKEEWLSDGSLQCVINLPAGAQSEFYDKLNAVTHGSAITQEIKEKSQ
ncbi:ribosome assembly factor SBDS [Candidatus Pacearchaeota archaeon]|nr:ribosome assembly factor SBDS [Candidatus Pacearchaeota archaeon]